MFDEDAKTRQEIKRLSKLVKKLPLLFARLGECHFRLGDPDRAEPILKRGVEKHPDYAGGLLALGEVYLFKGFIRDAEEVAVSGLAKHPHHLGLLQLMLRIRKRLEEEHEARRLESLLGTLDPLHASEDLCQDEAQAIAEEETEEAPPSPLATPASIWKLKAAARRQRRPQEEELPPETSADDQSSSPLAGILSEMETVAESGDLDDVTTEPVPESSVHKKIATKTLGELYARQNKFDEAIEIYDSLLNTNPDNESYRKRLQELIASREMFAQSQKEA
jgi:tetratricopeptide (TPR) repeat protein